MFRQLIGLLIFGNICFAQMPNGGLKLEYQVFTTSVNQIDKAQLYIQNEGAYYTSQYSDSATKKIGGTSALISDTSNKVQMYYQKASDSIFTLSSRESEHTESLIIGELRETIHWELKDTTKLINHHNCKLAIGDFRGRTYWAWYNPEIKTNEMGPWKLHGLPGAIVFAYDDEKYISFKLIQADFLPENQKTNFQINSNQQVVSRAEYRAFQSRIYNRMKSIDAPEGVTISIDVKVEELERD